MKVEFGKFKKTQKENTSKPRTTRNNPTKKEPQIENQEPRKKTKSFEIQDLFKISFKNGFWTWVKALDPTDPQYVEQHAIIHQVQNPKYSKTSTYNRVLELFELYLDFLLSGGLNKNV